MKHFEGITTTTEQEAVSRFYNSRSAATGYAVFFIRSGYLHVWMRDFGVQPAEIRISRTSSKKGAKKEYRFMTPASVLDSVLESGEAVRIMSEAEFEDYFTECRAKYPRCTDRGRACEILLQESIGRKWEFDKVPFTEGGDFETGTAKVQVKFGKGHLATEEMLKRMGF